MHSTVVRYKHAGSSTSQSVGILVVPDIGLQEC